MENGRAAAAIEEIQNLVKVLRNVYEAGRRGDDVDDDMLAELAASCFDRAQEISSVD